MSQEQGRLSESEHGRIFRTKVLEDAALDAKTSLEHPRAIILAGQPGSGKGGLAASARDEFRGDVILVDPDELRSLHPQASEFRNAHPYSWSGFTHPDASQWADELLQATKEGKKNLIFDTTLSNGEWTSSLIEDLSARGYQVEVRVMAAHKLESELGVDQRFSQRLDAEGFGRYVPVGAREAIYDKLPASLDTVHARTGVPISLYNREHAVLYDSRHDARAPGAVLQEARDARLNDPALSKHLNRGWQNQAGWHRDLPDVLPDNPRVTPPVAANTLQERAALGVEEGVRGNAALVHNQDFNIRVKPEVLGGMRVAGAAATLWDASTTANSVGHLRAQGNDVGANAQVIQFGARNVGGWAGGVIGTGLGATAGVETGPGLLLTGAIGGVVGAVGADAAVQWMEQRKINTQTDPQGRQWHLDPQHPDNGWTRQVTDTFAERGQSITHTEKAPDALADRLTYQASAEATQLRLATPDIPVDPYRIPADASDPVRPGNPAWERDPASGKWSRPIETFAERGLSSHQREPASAEKSAELEDYSQSIMARNVSRAPASVALRYEQLHDQAGWDRHEPVPEAITRAAQDTRHVTGSDGRSYTHDMQGQWTRESIFGRQVPAQDSMALELSQTRAGVLALRQPGLAPERDMSEQVSAGKRQQTLARDDQASALSPHHAASPQPLTPDHADHPDHALLEQIRAGVRREDQQVGRGYDQSSEQLSRSLLAACKDNRAEYPQQGNLSHNQITRADHVIVGGDNMFVVQGKLDDPAHLRAHVNIAQAMQTPVEQSDAKTQAAYQTMGQELVLAQQQELARNQTHSGPQAPSR